MPKIFKDSSGRFTLKTHETYKGVNFICRGTSRTSKSEAKANWEKNLEAKKQKIDNVDSNCDLSAPLKKALPEWYALYHVRSWRNERTKRTDHDTEELINTKVLDYLKKHPYIHAEKVETFVNLEEGKVYFTVDGFGNPDFSVEL